MAKRKGAVRIADIPPDILAPLNAGTLETATLAESLAVDFRTLLKAAAPELKPAEVERLVPSAGVTERMRMAGAILFDRFGANGYQRFATHPSDTVRGWGAYLLAADTAVKLKTRLERIRMLAADPHFGVREWAWLAVRPAVAAELPAAIKLLTPWTRDRAEGVRRFATEVTRPRGVWCVHLDSLKQDPEPGLPLLEPLRADPHKYVQDSVANWLNDASKTRPDWVTDLCERWLAESASPHTARICQRARRSLT
jgi:3-methyladenine DNA glycosylase AlkC